MSLFRKLSVASLLLTIAGQCVGWGGDGGTAETAAEIAMLVKTFGGGVAALPAAGDDTSGRNGARRKAADEPSQSADPTALLSVLLK